jgi:putative transposase
MRTPRLKLLHQPACYHIVCRITQGQLWLDTKEKVYLTALLRRVAFYCGVEVLTFCIMSNHFHLLVRVPEKASADAALDPEGLIVRVRGVYGIAAAEHLWSLRELNSSEATAPQWEAELAMHRGRMHDLSVFMKLLKQRFTMWHNHQHRTRGTLWTERFKSVLVEAREGAHNPLLLVAAYIDLNPVRAGVVTEAKDYPYSGYGSASLARTEAAPGLMTLTKTSDATSALVAYAQILDGSPLLDQPELTGSSIIAKALRSRQAALVKGAIIGSAAFVLEAWLVMADLRRRVRPQAYATGGMGDLWVGQRFRGTS